MILPIKAVVGEIVHWYEGGKDNNEPIPAIVTYVDTSQFICLSLINRNGMGFDPRAGIPHIDDPLDGINSSYLIEKGAWCRPMERVPPSERDANHHGSRIEQAIAAGYSIKDIANAMGPYWSEARVKKFLPKRETAASK